MDLMVFFSKSLHEKFEVDHAFLVVPTQKIGVSTAKRISLL